VIITEKVGLLFLARNQGVTNAGQIQSPSRQDGAIGRRRSAIPESVERQNHIRVLTAIAWLSKEATAAFVVVFAQVVELWPVSFSLDR